ncbi:hypothetical protein EJ04DRAFT_571614 [Polyplosphaeria fusca]|uniref:Zn(2)-C6 fungal-type domain-containing protein n=1 Tax=Polyplosphaeria fusca TaxID=682080 RepID=A0A9P4R992_9PLEO|nr:hypothetical protein EJ04DRAFT_571614 [Polyplosphaeria fusca]
MPGESSSGSVPMAPKRKHGATHTVEGDRLLPDESVPTTPQTAENYPRKRIAIACNVCRFRKTRCDAVKPSCGFCTDLGIECTYRKPTVGDRAKPTVEPPDALESVEARLSQLEVRLEYTHQLIQKSAVQSPPVPAHSEYILPREPRSRTSSLNKRVSNSLNTSTPDPFIITPASHDFTYRQTTTEALTPRPSLLTFRAPPFIHVESWDYTADFYDDGIIAGEQLSDQLDVLLLQPLDLTKRTLRRLQQSFVENFLRWTPIFDQKTCVYAVEQASGGDFQVQNSSTCLTMLLLAIGAISEDRSGDQDNQATGLDYFAHGCVMLERLSLRTGDITTLECRVLQASYFKFAIRPLQAWNSITQAARDSMHLLTSRILNRWTQTEQEAFHRVFWATSTILHELEATMKMHPIGLRHFHEVVPLPQFEEEDSGFFFFLAQISLRKFLTQSLEVVGYHAGRVIYAPVVTRELRKQVKEWYDHLPQAVRFPIDATPVFDSRKSFLRGQYIALFVVLGWPSVLKIMEIGDAGDGGLGDQELALTREQAQGCIQGCCLFLKVADEQLIGRKMGTHFTLWAAYATLATLLITFNCPALAFVEESKQGHHIKDAYEMLKSWDMSEYGFLRRGLERIWILMRQANLADIGSTTGQDSVGSNISS